VSAKIIDGKAVAARLDQKTAELVAKLGIRPGLAAILAGDDPASHLYVSLKEKACARLGIAFKKVLLPADAAEETVLAAVRRLNDDPDVDGFIVQLPLPPHLNEDKVVASIDTAKDADGFHVKNIAALLLRRELVVPGLVAGIMELIGSTGAVLAGKTAVIVANSRVFFEPLAEMLKRAGTGLQEYAESYSPKLRSQCRSADILIVAVGKPNFITGDMIKPGAIVIDVGTNRLGGKVVGDADAASVKEAAGWLTPVPGGVGPVTVAMLLLNTVKLASKRRFGT